MKPYFTTHFISGHLSLTEAEFEKHYRPKIDQALANRDCFVVGDAKGADELAQNYLLGKTTYVVVYHMFATPRNNAGFNTIGGFQTDEERDARMTSDSDSDIAWTRPGREKSGTQKNVDRRNEILKRQAHYDETLDPVRWMQRDPFPVRWIRFILQRFGVGYVKFRGDDHHFWSAAMRNAPISFRWFGRSISPSDLDLRFPDFDQWVKARKEFKEGDKIWPFVINPNTMAMRVGFVIVRNCEPITGIVVLSS